MPAARFGHTPAGPKRYGFCTPCPRYPTLASLADWARVGAVGRMGRRVGRRKIRDDAMPATTPQGHRRDSGGCGTGQRRDARVGAGIEVNGFHQFQFGMWAWGFRG
jgi:hypothetical protein